METDHNSAVREYLQRELAQLWQSAPAGLSSRSNLTLGDIIADGDLLLPQLWNFISPATRRNTMSGNIVPTVSQELKRKSAIVILGEAGVGKSLTLVRLFASQADKYLQDPDNELLPILVHCDSVQIDQVQQTRDYIADSVGQVETLLRSVPLDIGSIHELIGGKRLLLLLDGLDELPGSHDLVHSHER